MDFRMALTEISELFGTSFAFKGFCVKLKNGTELRIQDAKELNITCGERGVMMTGVLGGIDFSWHMFIVGTMFKVWMDLSSANEIEIERIDAIILDTLVDNDSRIALNDKYISASELPASADRSFGIYPPAPIDEGITFITSLPTKYPSKYDTSAENGRAKIIFTTDTSSACEKEIISEKTCIYNYMSRESAVEEYRKNFARD